MAEYGRNGYVDKSIENAVSPSKVAKSSNIRYSSSLYSSLPLKLKSASCISNNDLHHLQHISRSCFEAPPFEPNSDPIRTAEGNRPGTPALPKHFSIENDEPDNDYHFDDLDPQGSGNAEERGNRGLGSILYESDHPYPPTAAPPTSPSHLFTLLLQRDIRPSGHDQFESRPQAYPSNYIESSLRNNYQAKTTFQDGHARDLHDIKEQEHFAYRPISNVCRRFEQLGRMETRPFLNQNYSCLPNNMVRIKTTNGETEAMNGFKEDDQGNHECHNLLHEENPTLETPVASTSEHHHSGLFQVPTDQTGVDLGNIYQGEWPHRALWMSGPSSIGEKDPLDGFGFDDTESIMSFSSTTATMSSHRHHSHQLGAKVEMVYSLLSMLGSCNKEDMSRTLLEMSSNQDSCIAMRQSGCLPLLIQLLHGTEREQVLSEQTSSANMRWAVREARRRASQALHNIVHAHPEDRRSRREARVLRLLEQIRDYSDFLRDCNASKAGFSQNENLDLHPGPAIAALMKLSFDEEHRHAMCQLGGLQAIAELIQADYEVHGNTSDQFCVTVRRYAGMALTNLTFGDGTNKALLCSMKPFMQALVAQLGSPSEDLRQVTASVLRNLSWRADASSKQILQEVGVVKTLMKAALEAQKESTLKSILSALWNLSAHCSMNKAEICEVEGALEFLVSTLTYKSASSTLSIVENGGGILRNISSHIAVREDYRAILRKQKCLQTLLTHLKSPSLTIVSNACGTLWNLSARCAEDQRALWDMGAVGMLRNLIHSKHKMISMGSSAALKNLLTARPEGLGYHSENGKRRNSSTPSLLVRKQKALAADLDENLSETCDNIESPKTSPMPQSDYIRRLLYDRNFINGHDKRPQFIHYLPGRMYHSISGHVGSPIRVPRSESKDSLGSTRSEPPHYKAQKERFKIFVNSNRVTNPESQHLVEKSTEWKEKTNLPYEGNSNVVLQLFKQLQNDGRPDSGDGTDSGCHSGPESLESKPPVRPSTLTPPKRGVWNIRSGELGIHNLPTADTSYTFSRTNSHHLQNSQPYLEAPGNRNGNMAHGRQTHDCKPNDFGLHEGIATREAVCSNKPSVVLRRKKPSDAMSSSLIITNRDSMMSEDSTDNTLVHSRCSSLNSLTSCFQQSARNSWVSDVSQRTSAIISPSDFTESPSFCNSEHRPHIYEFTDKVPDPETHGLIRPKPAWPTQSLAFSDSLSSSVNRMSLDSDVFVNETEVVPISPSDVNECIETPTPVISIPGRPPNSPVSLQKDSYSSSEASSSQENKGDDDRREEDLIAASISQGTPNNARETHHNNSRLHSKLNNLCSPVAYTGSGIPVKTNIESRMAHPSPSKARVTSSLEQFLNSATSKSKSSDSHSLPKPVDDNDNPINAASSIDAFEKQNTQLKNSTSSLAKPRQFTTSEHNFAEPEKSSLSSFESKCLSICKKYPGLSQKSSFQKSSLPVKLSFSSEGFRASKGDSAQQTNFSSGSRPKTSIPQISRAGSSNFGYEEHKKQLNIKSSNLTILKSSMFNIEPKQENLQTSGGENRSSTEDNLSEDAFSTSPSACESEGNLSDDAPEVAKSSELVLRNNRVKSRKTKANRRSMEIRIPSDEQSSEEDNKNAFILANAAVPRISLPSGGGEVDGRENERTAEKGAIPDLLEGMDMGQDFEPRSQDSGARNNLPRMMSESMELRRGALMIAAELEEGLDDCTHSSSSFDLQNMMPPSCMAEMSMTSSGLSDLFSNGNSHSNGKIDLDRRRNNKRSKKLTNNRRFVLKSVRQAFVNNLELSKQKESNGKPMSASTSVENVSWRSSGTSDLIDNINPPSVLDDLSMTNSCASLNSINSDILESRSQSLADPGSGSEMFERLHAAAAIVQVYSRELSTIMTGSMKSSCNSECLDLVKPPSVFQDIAEVTVEDGSEVASDALVSDFELEEELPHDDEASIPSETVHSPFLLSSKRDIDGSTEHLNSSIGGDSLMDRESHSLHSARKISSLALEPQKHNIIDMGSNCIQHSHPNMTDDELAAGIADTHGRDESAAPAKRGPRIVKPINRETIRQMQEKKIAETSAKAIRGRVPVNKPKNLLQQVTTGRMNGSSKLGSGKISSPVVCGVRPTRTSALRASQNKQNNIKSGGRVSPRSFLSKPPVPRATKFNKAVTPRSVSASENKQVNQTTEIQRPSPPVKQNTFTKEDSIPIQKTLRNSEEALGNDKNNNGKDKSKAFTSHYSNEPKVYTRMYSFPVQPCSQTKINAEKIHNAPLQRMNSEKQGIPSSSSSCSLGNDDKAKRKLPDKKSPSMVKQPSVGSRTASANSLSSVSSTSFSFKRNNSQKDVPSKISSIWKCNDSSSSNSPVTESASFVPGSSKTRALPARSSTIVASSTTLPPKGIPRSSTYEKISTISGTSLQQQLAPAPRSAQVPRTRTPSGAQKAPTKKNLPSAASKPSGGGARIVKPVTPRPKPSAITPRSLRQSNFCPYSDARSYVISSGSSSCISIERTSRDPNQSIPLVTAPFALASRESNPSPQEVAVNSSGGNMSKKDSDSENSDKED